ncbi:MAG: Sugar phosphate permease [Chloroflexi bacterium]|jgi:MFS family permease|nr:MAG: Sugar phosphate permease [Chloroflexota bacterium]
MKAKNNSGYFYGWNIIGAAFLSRFSFASGNASILGLFFTPLNAQLGWSRTSIAGVLTLSRLFEGITSPIVGTLLDRYGSRWILVVGGIILSLGFMGLSAMTNLWQFYLVRGIFMAIGFSLVSMLVTNTTISNWFVVRRGRAIALAGMGTSTGMLIISPITVAVIAVWGWQTAWIFFAVLAWLVVVIPSALIMKRRPEDMGLKPDGEVVNSNDYSNLQPEKSVQYDSTKEAVWTRRQVVRTPAFWLLITAISSSMFAFQGVNISIAPYAEDLGFGAAAIALMLMARSVATILVTPMWGMLSEHVHLPTIRVIPFLIQLLATALLTLADTNAMLWFGIVVYGAGFTGMMIIQEVLWANYYGRLTLGTVRSTSLPLQVLISGGGPVLINLVFDLTGSYRPAYAAFIGLYLMSAILIWFAKPPIPYNFANPDER